MLLKYCSSHGRFFFWRFTPKIENAGNNFIMAKNFSFFFYFPLPPPQNVCKAFYLRLLKQVFALVFGVPRGSMVKYLTRNSGDLGSSRTRSSVLFFYLFFYLFIFFLFFLGGGGWARHFGAPA